MVFHPDLGRPSPGEHPLARAAIERLERLAELVVPRWAWAYIHAWGVRA